MQNDPYRPNSAASSDAAQPIEPPVTSADTEQAQSSIHTPQPIYGPVNNTPFYPNAPTTYDAKRGPYDSHQHPYSTSDYPQDTFPPTSDPNGESAQNLGVIALIGLLGCQLMSIIFGIWALRKSSISRRLLHRESREAKNGRICGLIALILGCVQIFAVFLVILIGILKILFLL